MDTNSSTLVTRAGLGLIAIVAASDLCTAIPRLSLGQSESMPSTASLYEDEDGMSTPQSNNLYSIIWPTSCLVLSTIVGLVTAEIIVLGTVPVTTNCWLSFGSCCFGPCIATTEPCLNLAAWYLIGLQEMLILSAKVPPKAYHHALHASICSTSLLTMLLVQEVGRLNRAVTTSSSWQFLFILQIMATVLVTIAGLLHPRRPDVFSKSGQLIDRQNTTTALGRLTFHWATSILNMAWKNSFLELHDLPRPDRQHRSTDLANSWARANRTGPLWSKIFRAHIHAFIVQWALTLVQGFSNNAPQFAFLQILRILEKRETGETTSGEAWMWVVAFGLFQALSVCLDSTLSWISHSKLASPVRAELSTLVFRKAMSRNNATGSIDYEKHGNASTVNIIGVDVKRVSDFLIHNNFFLGAFAKLGISFLILLEIIGWRALGTGLLSMLAIVPINTYASRYYAESQQRLMKLRDEKQRALSESLQGIRQIKFEAWESRWQEAINAIRSRELDVLWVVFQCETAMMFCWVSSPIILSASTLVAYGLHNVLNPSVAFTAIATFNNLQATLANIPEAVTEAISAGISARRIEKYFAAPEVAPLEQSNFSQVTFTDATFSFPSDQPLQTEDDRFTLRNISLAFPENELSVISGKTGSGKSLLLAAVLGEVDIISGCIHAPPPPSPTTRQNASANQKSWILPNAVAFVAQVPWIENASIKENILFGLPFYEQRYLQTLESAALTSDLEVLPDGDETDIGPNGINLSGGQKWRLSFARALYSRAGILVLDDIFSAVDAHIGRHLFEKGLTGDLGVNRTRILATHHLALCKLKTAYLVQLGAGRLLYAGPLSDFESYKNPAEASIWPESKAAIQKIQRASIANDDKIRAEYANLQSQNHQKPMAKKFVEEELKKRGRVKGKMYLDYAKSSGGWLFWLFAIVILISQQALNLGRSWWLHLWTSASEQSVLSGPKNAKFSQSLPEKSLGHSFREQGNLSYLLSGYVGISLLSSIISTLSYFYLYCGSLKASKRLFSRMLSTILHSPLLWLDKVPAGRVMSRFTADFNVIDSKIAVELGAAIRALFKMIGILIAGFLVSPAVVCLGLILAIVSVSFSQRYLVGAREVRRINSVTRSPILSKFDAALSGLATIRAFDKTEDYIASMSSLVDDQTTSDWHLMLFNCWFSWRISMISTIFSTCVAFLVVFMSGIEAALAGFVLYSALDYNSAINWIIRIYSSIELDMNAVERVVEYASLPTEDTSGIKPPISWPTDGRLEITNLSVRYASDLPFVLHDLTFYVAPRQRVGVIGRTGAGKSSLVLALYRFLEPQSGGIQIDGLDVATVRLKDLRSRLTIIPQDPVMFSGTIRSNLDPFGEHSEHELINALRCVQLIPDDAKEGEAGDCNMFASLDTSIASGGLNLSQGQRQLLALARAILSRPRIMLLDEATSAVDMATDSAIQRSLREQFAASTLLVIAHRLSTVVDFDRILVLDQGTVLEYGAPYDLYHREGAFRSMVEDSGQKSELEEILNPIARGTGHGPSS